jgi:hypothetical protein
MRAAVVRQAGATPILEQFTDPQPEVRRSAADRLEDVSGTWEHLKTGASRKLVVTP